MLTQRMQYQNLQLILPQDLTGRQRAWADLVMNRFIVNGDDNGPKKRRKMAPEWDAAIKAGYTPQPVSDKIVPPTVFSRSSKEEITQLQKKRNAAGYDVPVNGIYSSGTKAAVTRFQEANGLTPHGIAESDTLKKLDEVCQVRQTHAASVIRGAVQPARHEAEQGPVFSALQNQASMHTAIQPQVETTPHHTQLQHGAVHEMAYKTDGATHVGTLLPGEGGRGDQVSEPFLGEGAHGHYVSDVQNRLNALNYTGPDGGELAVDGRLGPATRYGVEEFQRENGLRVDGFVGPETHQKIALRSSISVQQYSPTA